MFSWQAADLLRDLLFKKTYGTNIGNVYLFINSSRIRPLSPLDHQLGLYKSERLDTGLN